MCRCYCCRGTGWKREIDSEVRVILRIYICPCCEGTGDFSFRKNIEEIIAPMIIAANIDVPILIETLNNIDKLKAAIEAV